MTRAKTAAQILPYIYAAGAIIIVWQAVVTFTNAHVALLPPPLLTAKTFIDLAISGQLFIHIGASLGRVVSAWILSVLVAVPLGLAIGRWRRVEKIVDPVIELFRPISPLAWIPLAILWFGIGESGKIFIIFIATFFPILLNTVAGVKGVDPVLIRAGQVLGCDTDRALFTKVILPAAMPTIVVGLRISFGTGWAAIIAAELVAARVGLGYLIADGMEILRSDLVLVGMITIGILGVLIDAAFRILNNRFAWGS
ncbi:MAG: ABC transporter permease [Proteobacteria bacterium]|nr:ABC transporter permease [Pseudomonadota bacterium]